MAEYPTCLKRNGECRDGGNTGPGSHDLKPQAKSCATFKVWCCAFALTDQNLGELVS
jgi:hypothetical protein